MSEMPKLTRQQIIILSVMTLVILFAVYDFFIAPRSKTDVIDIGTKTSELEAFLTDITSKLPKGSLPAADAYILSRAELAWVHDPFYERKSFREWEKRKEQAKASGGMSQKVGFSYSGYLKVGNKNLAIINGIEYEAGEPMEIEGYILKKIYPAKVVIVNKKSGANFDVPLQE
jgi:hypothetical protein